MVLGGTPGQLFRHKEPGHTYIRLFWYPSLIRANPLANYISSFISSCSLGYDRTTQELTMVKRSDRLCRFLETSGEGSAWSVRVLSCTFALDSEETSCSVAMMKALL